MLRLAAAALRARLTEAAQRVARRIYGTWCWAVFLLVSVPVAGLVVLLRAPAIGRCVVHHAARIFLALTGMRLCPTPLTACLLYTSRCV